MKRCILIILVAATLTGCFTSRIADAEPGYLVSSEPVKHSTLYLLCIETKSGQRFSGYYNVHCYGCNATIPVSWDVVKLKNGKLFFRPVN